MLYRCWFGTADDCTYSADETNDWRDDRVQRIQNTTSYAHEANVVDPNVWDRVGSTSRVVIEATNRAYPEYTGRGLGINDGCIVEHRSSSVKLSKGQFKHDIVVPLRSKVTAGNIIGSLAAGVLLAMGRCWRSSHHLQSSD
jgi:hypothetical protein